MEHLNIPLDYKASRLLTGTVLESGDGIFHRKATKVMFSRGKFTVEVFFGVRWCDTFGIEEIKRRVRLVNQAFENKQVVIFASK